MGWKETIDKLAVAGDNGRGGNQATTLERERERMNPNYYQDVDDPTPCAECGHPCHSDDAVTDGTIALCGAFRGNGCADRAMWDRDVIVGVDERFGDVVYSIPFRSGHLWGVGWEQHHYGVFCFALSGDVLMTRKYVGNGSDRLSVRECVRAFRADVLGVTR